MMDILTMLIILIAASLAGRTVLGLLRLGSEDRLRNFVFSAGLGLALLIFLTSACAAFSLIAKWTAHALIVLLFLIGSFHLPGVVKYFGKILRLELSPALSFLRFCIAAMILAGASFALIRAVAPPVGMDSLTYHLNLMKEFMIAGGIYPVPYDVNALWPLNFEMLSMFGLMLGSLTVAKMFNFLMGILTVPVIYLIARKFASKTYALLAAALYYLMPIVIHQSGYAYVDVSVSFYISLLVLLLVEWMEEPRAHAGILLGIFGGVLLGAKFTNVIMLGSLGIVMLLWVFIGRKYPIKRLTAIFFFGAVSVILASHWYLRSFVHLGNPIYPYLNGFFGLETVLEMRGATVNFMRLFTAPWLITMKPELMGGVGNQLGPVIFALFPLAVISLKRDMRLKGLFLAAVIFYLGWFFVKQNLRFLLPVTVILYPMIAVGLEKVARFKVPHILMSILIGGILVLFLGIGTYYAKPDLPFFLGKETEKEYLNEREPTYGLGKVVDEIVPENEPVLMVGEIKRFYIPRKTLRADGFNYMGDFERLVRRDRDLLPILRGMDIEYVVIAEYENVPEPDYVKPTKITDMLKSEDFLEEYYEKAGQYEWTGERGDVRYEIYKRK